ncbi:MAG: hypothetical protein EOP45_15835 [Sphingobacteriaceae bacterium]|nr:MAG: hypothetical protein EOP45_15835 [Sphingobacteriaceae bacterium]
MKQMENVRNEEPNKYEKWEIVKVVNDRSGVVQGCSGFITKMKQYEKSGTWEYSIYLYECESVWECSESEIESTGQFIPKKEQEERTKIISRRPKFDFDEIIKIINHEDDHYDEFIGRKGRISGMAQDYNDGSWEYGMTFFEPIGDDSRISSLLEENLQTTGEFVPKNYGMSNMSFSVSTGGEVTDVKIDNPQSWEDKVIAKEWENKN